jgi:glutathione synthase/RimK-type ligase-like ATP-grasp enzyme
MKDAAPKVLIEHSSHGLIEKTLEGSVGQERLEIWFPLAIGSLVNALSELLKCLYQEAVESESRETMRCVCGESAVGHTVYQRVTGRCVSLYKQSYS